MTVNEILPILLAPVATLAVEEFASQCPRLAKGLVCCSVRRLDDDEDRERYLEEFLASLNEVEGRVSKLLTALGYMAYIPRLRRELRIEHRDQEEPAEQSARDAPAKFIAIY